MSTTITAQAVRSLCTPDQHSQTSKTKPVILLALGTGPYGKTAILEFPEGWQRTIDLVSQFDGGHPLFSDLQQSDKQRLRSHVTLAAVRHSNSTQSRPDPLSFVRHVQTPRGKCLEIKYFDVPSQDYAEGTVTGYRCAGGLLEALAFGHGPYIPISYVMAKVAEAQKEGFASDNRRAAAAFFMDTVADGLRFFANNLNHQQWINKSIAHAEAYKEGAQIRKDAKRTEFVERMKVAKTAKREALAAMAHVSQVMEAEPA